MPAQPKGYNLLELFKAHREIDEVLSDPTSLFLLGFVNEIGETSRAALQVELALDPAEFAQIINRLNRAELLGLRADRLSVTPGGRQFLDDLGLGRVPTPPPPQAPVPPSAAMLAGLFGAGAVILLAILLIGGAMVFLMPRATPTPTKAAVLVATRTYTPSPTATLTPSMTPSSSPTPKGLERPQDLAIYARTGNVWVTNGRGESVAEVDAQDPNVVLDVIRNVPSPNGIAIWQVTGLAYVTNADQGTVTEIDLQQRRVTRSFDVGSNPQGIAVDEQNGLVYVANSASNTVSQIDVKAGKVNTFDWSAEPLHLAYVYNRASAVYVVSRSGAIRGILDGKPQPAFAVSKGGFDLAVFPNGQGGYVTNPEARQVLAWTTLPRITTDARIQLPQITLKNAPVAIANLARCIGVVVPGDNALETVDYGLTGQSLRVHPVGKQGKGGGVAYDAENDAVYVANPDEDSITRIEAPCPILTPTPVPAN